MLFLSEHHQKSSKHLAHRLPAHGYLPCSMQRSVLKCCATRHSVNWTAACFICDNGRVLQCGCCNQLEDIIKLCVQLKASHSLCFTTETQKACRQHACLHTNCTTPEMKIMQLYLRHLFILDAIMQLKEDSANHLSKVITYAHKCNPIFIPIVSNDQYTK